MLTDHQRADLHAAIVKYIAQRGYSTAQLAEFLDVGDTSGNSSDLEQKWTVLVRLQRRILDLEQQNTKLTTELKAANSTIKEQEIQLSSKQQHNGNASGSGHTSLANWLPKWPPKQTLYGHRSRVTALSFHPNWSFLASSDDNSEIKVWDYEQGELERTLKAHTRAVLGLCFSPVSHLLVSCSADLSIKVFSPKQDFANIRTLAGHEHTVSAVVSFPDSSPQKREYIASASRDKTVRLWELDSGFPVAVLRGHTDWVRCLDFSTTQSGQPVLISSGSDRTVRLYELFVDDNSIASAPLVYEGGHSHVIECCAIAPPASTQFLNRHLSSEPSVDSKLNVFFASAGRDSVISVWHSQHRKPILRLVGHENWVQGVEFHPNGRFMVSVSDDKTMRVWDLATGKLVRTIDAHDHFVTGLAWKGKNIATGSVDQTVKLW